MHDFSPKKNSESYNIIFDLAPIPMWIYDLDTLGFLAVNEEAVRHYGYTKEEFLSLTLRNIRPPEDIPKLEKAIEVARSRSEIFKKSLFRHQKKDGSIIQVQIKSNLIDYNGKKAEIVTAVDLTERHNHEELIDGERQYLSIIGELNEILLKTDNWSEALVKCLKIIGQFLNVHRAYFYQNNLRKETTSKRLKWIRNQEKAQIDSPEHQDIPFANFPLFISSLKNGEHFEAIVSDLAPSSTKDDLEDLNVCAILVLPVMVNNHFAGFIRLDDCEKERKWQENEFQLLKALTSNLGHVIKEAQAHQKLVDNEAKFRALVIDGHDLIAILNSKGDYKYVAPTSTKVLGISPEEFIGKSAFDLVNGEDKPRLRKIWSQLPKQKRISVRPHRIMDAHGKWQWIQTDLTNHLSNPAIAGIVANTKEVTLEMETLISEKLLASLTKIINQPGSLASCLTEALKKLVKLSKVNIGEVWLLSEDKTRMDLISKACQTEKFKSFYQNSLSVDSFKKGEGLPGYIWDSPNTFILENLAENKLFLRSKAAELNNLNTAIGIPIMEGKEVLGCLICFCKCGKNELSDQVKLLTKVGLQMGSVIKQKLTEEMYRNFFNISPDPHCLLGFDGYLKKFNKAVDDLLGYDTAELMSHPVFHFIHEDDKAKVKARFDATIISTNTDSFSARFLTKSGKVKWLLWRGAVIPESKIIVAVAKDITEQKEAELELSTAYERLKTAQKIAKLGYWMRDFNSKISVWSEEVYKIHELTPENFIPSVENVSQTFHPDDRHLIENNPGDKLEPGKVHSFEHRIITANNVIKWVRQEIRLLSNEKQIPFKIEGTIQDITERKEYELQLAISNERFKLAIQASNEMIWEIDHQNQSVTRGTGYEKTFNSKSTHPFSKQNSWYRKIHPSDLDEVWDSLQIALQDKNENYWSKEYKIIAKNGAISHVVDRCYILRDSNGIPIRSVGSVLDVTASRQQLEKIQQQNENLREIAWLQSHVIRAPLAKIMGLINLVKEHDAGGKSLGEVFDMISVSADELDKVIHEIIEKTDGIKEEDTANSINR